MSQNILVLCLVALFFSTTANAIVLEPYLGYSSGTEKGTMEVTSSGFPFSFDIDDKWSGMAVGARLGFDIVPGFDLGVDATSASLEFEERNEKANVLMWGLYASYDFPIMLRAWGTYYISSKATFDDSEATGSGAKLGLGYTGLPFININFEYLLMKGTDASIETAGAEVTSYDTDFTGYAISLSYPIEF